MQWSGEGLLIGSRRHGETSLIVEAMVVGRGRHLGLVRGGRSRRNAATLQPGNSVALTWRARLDNHLGNYTVELLQSRAADLIENRLRLYAFQVLADHLRLLPERDPHDELLAKGLAIIDGQDNLATLAAGLVRFELRLLEELGFGLDLSACAVSGETAGLAFVSPRTGRAVTAAIGAPYKERLLALPAFVLSDVPADAEQMAAAFSLTGHFLADHVWKPRNIAPSAARDRLIAELGRL